MTNKFVPVITVLALDGTKQTLPILKFKVQRISRSAMTCDSCGVALKRLTPKGRFKTKHAWFTLCYNCCVEQGLI